ncbi:putative ribonuclease H-like domain-containing protein [Tanacetum coccineum]
MNVSPIPTTRIYKDHPKEKIIGDPLSALQTRRITKLQKVWRLVDLPKGKHAIGTKWANRNKKDKRGIVVRKKVRLVAQGYTQEEGIDYDEVFAPIAKIKAIRLFLAYASFMGFIMYQMDVKSAFLYGTIEEEVYVCQPPGFEDPRFPDKVYKVEKALYGLHQAPRAWYETLSTYLLENGFKRGTIDKTLFIKKDKGDILLVQVYVDDIIFGSTKKSLCVEFEQMMQKRFQMSSMGELTFFLGLQVKQKDDRIFISQDKFQVTPKVTHLHAVKRIFRYLKGQPKLGLWYPRDSPFDLEAFSDSDYARASLDRKSTTRAEYVAAANCCGQVLWIQNKMLDYAVNFMNTKIHIDNESTIVKNLVFHSKTKHIEIRNHFIRDSYKKRLIQVIKINTDHNVADLLTNAFDVSSDEFRVKTGSCKVNAAWQDLVLLGKKGNADFHQIVDFLNVSTIRYCLTISPTIYASYIEQFWATTKSKIVNNETQIHAKVDGKTIVISESSVRSNLHFNDEDGVTTLTNSKILENLALMGYEIVGDEAVHKELGDRVKRASTTATSLDVAQDSEAMRGVIAQTRFERASKHSYDSALLGVNTPGSDEERLEQHELTDNVTPTPHDSPLLGGHTPGSDEGRLQQDTFMDIVIALSQKVEGLESDLKKTKKLYATAFKKLINRVKSLEDELKFQKSKSNRRRLALVTSKDEEDLVAEDPSKQGRSLIEEMDLDAGISLVPLHVEVQGSPQRNTDTTADDLTLAETLMEIKKSVSKDKGKDQMDETESPRKMKQRERVQISRDEEVAQKLQEKFDAAERQRMAQLQAGEKYGEEDLPMKLMELVNQRKKFFAQQRADAKRNKPMNLAQQKDYMSNYIKNQEGGYSIKQLKSLSFEQVKDIFETTMRRVQSFMPIGSELEVQRLKRAGQEVLEKPVKRHKKDLVKERFITTEPTNDKEKELWVELKRLYEPYKDDILWKLQRYMHDPLVWRLYDTCGVHHVSSIRGHNIFMLVEKEYPLNRGTLGLMMVARLLVGADSEMSRELLRKIFYQANRPRQ